MFACVYDHLHVIWSYVCACIFVSIGVEVYAYIHLRMGLYICLCKICMYGVRTCMYVSIRNCMSVCERCM